MKPRSSTEELVSNRDTHSYLESHGFGGYTVKLGDKEHFDKEQIGVKEPFPMTNLPIYSQPC